ncbi:serine/threonine-protein kinase [Kocuria sabuli]|uniref:serine/threonine-protein kinase n=1 Tax=Kocuria sabuli TaxID=3071448 RepID=UPI0034D4CF11
MADTIAGRYTLIDPIARGGSGSVWRAWDGRLQQLCAAKVLRQRDSADLLRFAREQSVKLDHPHVLAPYGWAAEDAHVVIAMPLIHGGTLESALLDNGAASAQLTEEVLAQLLRALQFVHAQGWVHRDVKPGNLMLDSTGTGRPHVFLSDFGIAVRVQDARLTRTGTVVGTPGYLPPEVYGLADPDPAQDLYAAGITALRMLDPALEPEGSLGPNDARAVVGEQGDLAEHLAALLTPDPALRRDAAVSVLDALTAGAAGRTFAPALTRDGEPFEVFDVLDPLPEPWASRVLNGWDGPGGGGAETPSPGDRAPGAEDGGPDTVAPAATTPAAVTPDPGGPVTVAAAAGRDGHGRATGAAPSRAHSAPGSARTTGAAASTTETFLAPPDGAAPSRRRGGALRGLLAALAGVTVLVGGYLALDVLGLAEQVSAPTGTPSVSRDAEPTPSATPEETPVQLEEVCEDIGGGEQSCSFRVP